MLRDNQRTRQIRRHIPEMDLSQAQLLGGVAEEKRYGVGHVIFDVGDAGTILYLVLEGCICLCADVPLCRGVILASLGPSEFLGWSAVLCSSQKMARAEVVSPARVLSFDAEKVLALCDLDPQLGYVLMRRLAQTIGNRLLVTRMRMLEACALTTGQ